MIQRCLFSVAKDLSWAYRAGANPKPIVPGTFVIVISEDDTEETARKNAKIRLEKMARNERLLKGALE